jgi:sulfur relay (sulfurtransferase) complex TusBCD TusD component (DsrE family)
MELFQHILHLKLAVQIPNKNAYTKRIIFFYRYYSQAKSAQTPKKMEFAEIQQIEKLNS